MMIGPIVLLAAITVTIGIAGEPFFALANRAAEQLLNPAEYIQAVLGGRL
jgi:multicomponent Na+:H+ antiporter subunit D